MSSCGGVCRSLTAVLLMQGGGVSSKGRSSCSSSVGELNRAEARVLALLVSALLLVEAEAQSLVAVLCGQVLDGGCYAWIIGCFGNSGDDTELAFTVFPLFSHAFAAFAPQNDRLRSGLEQRAQV